MGNNLDLCEMLGAPSEVECPKCGNKGDSYFEDYDVEVPGCNPGPGRWKLRCYCPECDHEWTVEYRVKLQHVTKG